MRGEREKRPSRTMSEMGASKTVTVIMPTCIVAEYTKRCLDTLKKHTRRKYTLVAVGSGLDAEKKKRLNDWLKPHRGCKKMWFDDNVGYSIACNAAIKKYPADYYVYLNDDVALTKGWLSKMVAIMEANPKLGVLVPAMNAHGTLQCIDKVANHVTMPDLPKAFDADIYNAAMEKEFAGRYLRAHDMLAFSCSLTPHWILEKIGLQDERFPTGFAADNDWCYKLHLAGYEFGVAIDTVVEHGWEPDPTRPEQRTTYRMLGMDTMHEHERQALAMLRNKWPYVKKHPDELVSIVIPTYNCANDLRECLASISMQSYPFKEIIVVDDASTDHTRTVMDDFPNVVYMDNLTRLGANASRNKGALIASGKYIVFCDADKKYTPSFLSKMVYALKRAPVNVGYIYADFYEYGERARFHTSGIFNALRLKQINYIDMSSLIRREAFPGFDEQLGRLQDWDLWLRMLHRGYEGEYIDETLYIHRLRPDSITQIDDMDENGQSASYAQAAADMRKRHETTMRADDKRAPAPASDKAPPLQPKQPQREIVPVEKHPVANGRIVFWGAGGEGTVVGHDNGAYRIRNRQSIAGIVRDLTQNVPAKIITGVLKN